MRFSQNILCKACHIWFNNNLNRFKCKGREGNKPLPLYRDPLELYHKDLIQTENCSIEVFQYNALKKKKKRHDNMLERKKSLLFPINHISGTHVARDW